MSVYSIPVTLGIDEEAIEKKIASDIEKHVSSEIEKRIRTNLFESNYYRQESRIEEIARQELVKMLDENGGMEKIIELAADKLADKLSRQKAVKEKAVVITKEIFGE